MKFIICIFFIENLQKTNEYIIYNFNHELKLALDSRALALVLVSRVLALASSLAFTTTLTLTFAPYRSEMRWLKVKYEIIGQFSGTML